MTTRREFLGTSATTFLAAAAAATDGAEIMDTHVHFYDPGRPQGVPWPRKDETRLYRRVMPEHYPDQKSKVLIVEASPWIDDNQWILDLAKKHPALIRGCIGNLDPASPDFPRHIAKLRQNPLFLGIRLNTGRLEKSFDKLAPLVDAGLALDIIGNGEMYAWAARLSDRYPALRMILDHLPLEKRDPSIAELRTRPNVYAKVSWILRAPDDTLANRMEALDEVWSVFGEDRVVYGTNWPVSDLSAPFGKVQAAAIDYFRKKPLAKYLSGNSRKIYRWTS